MMIIAQKQLRKYSETWIGLSKREIFLRACEERSLHPYPILPTSTFLLVYKGGWVPFYLINSWTTKTVTFLHRQKTHSTWENHALLYIFIWGSLTSTACPAPSASSPSPLFFPLDVIFSRLMASWGYLSEDLTKGIESPRFTLCVEEKWDC